MSMNKKRPVSKGFQKTLNTFQELIATKEIQVEIAKIRKEYGVIVSSYSQTEPLDHVDLNNLPFDWLSNDTWEEKKKRFERLEKRLSDFLVNHGYYSRLTSPSPLVDYVFYGRFIPFQEKSRILGIGSLLDTFSMNSCVFHDVLSDKLNYLNATTAEKIRMDKIDALYPIAIRISPYASQGEIISFIKQAFPFIEELQSNHVVAGHRHGKSRMKNQQIIERDELISSFKGSRKDLITNLKRFFPKLDPPDEGATLAIRSKIRKRRGM